MVKRVASWLESSGQRLVVLLAIGISASPAAAQGAVDHYQAGGQVARSSVGQIGQRETREKAAAKINPSVAVPGRIQNRVQSRLRTRIDKYYDPQANRLSPFIVAGEQSRKPIGRGR